MDLTPLSDFCHEKEIPLSSEQIDKFQAFATALYAQNAVMNLTRVPEAQCCVRHFVDSLLVVPWIPEDASVLDIGCGPGFPSWPLACLRPDLHVTGIDSSSKMLSFLASQHLPNLKVVNGRAEELKNREAYDVVTGRALAPLAAQMELSAAWVKLGGCFLPFRTPAEEDQFAAASAAELGLELEAVHHASLPGGMGERAFPVYRKVSRTPRQYPRTWAEIKKRPLG